MDTSKTINKIDKDILHINRMIEWSNVFLKDESKRKTRSQLVDSRRKLNRIKSALLVNPAASIFGESQVGKSYLVDCLLADDKGALKVYDGEGREYDFINEINPVGGGKEATAIVTRFTTRNFENMDKAYPVEANLLSAKDLLLVIVDSYFNELKQQKFCTSEDLMEKIADLKADYMSAPIIKNNALTEDDLYDIKEYFEGGNNFSTGFNEAVVIVKSGFFEELGVLIEKIPWTDWASVFSILWNENPMFTGIFERILKALHSLHFENKVSVKMDAVLRIKGTVLDVERIRELFGENTAEKDSFEKNMVVKTSSGIVNIGKSEFCAITSELVFRVKNELEHTKSFLKQLDLLDFPGARSRNVFLIKEDYNEQLLEGEFNKTDLVLRGKVAYLFNLYASNYYISNMLFCHHEKQSEVKTLSELLTKWVYSAIGNTVEERSRFMQDAKVSPLFIVGTKFNLDMVKDTNDDTAKDSQTRLSLYNERWNRRFSSTLSSVVQNTGESHWFNQWTKDGAFNNMYLLRSFEFSDRGGIFSGYLKEEKRNEDGMDRIDKVINLDENGDKIGEIDYAPGYELFLKELKKSFVNYHFIKKHFNNPEKSWDEAATLRKDGSEWIIENLTLASQGTLYSRNESFKRQLEGYEKTLVDIMNRYFHDDNADLLIQKAKEKAGKIEFQLDKLFGTDRLFFSQFIAQMLIPESAVHDLLLESINDIMMVEDTDTSAYFAIRDRAKIDPTLSKDENIERIRLAYNFNTTQDVLNYCESQSLSIDELLKPRVTRNFATIITDVVVNEWFNRYLTPEHYADFIERGFSKESLEDLLTNMQILFKHELNIEELISNTLRRYVLNPSSLDMMVEMLADISSEMINRFVNDMGYSYYSRDRWSNIVKSNDESKLDLNLDKNILDPEKSSDHQTIEKVFHVLDNLDEVVNQVPLDTEKIKFIPNYSSFVRWTSLMKISFIAACKIPVYDRLANDELRGIINSYQNSETAF